MEQFDFNAHIDTGRLAQLDRDMLSALLESPNGQKCIQRMHDTMLDYTGYELAMYINVLLKSSTSGTGLDYIRYLRSVGWKPQPPEEEQV